MLETYNLITFLENEIGNNAKVSLRLEEDLIVNVNWGKGISLQIPLSTKDVRSSLGINLLAHRVVKIARKYYAGK